MDKIHNPGEEIVRDGLISCRWMRKLNFVLSQNRRVTIPHSVNFTRSGYKVEKGFACLKDRSLNKFRYVQCSQIFF